MEMSERVKTLIDSTWEKNGEIVFVAYAMIEKTENSIKYLLNKTFAGCEPDYAVPVFSCIKELTTNSIKANIKKVLIDEKIIVNPDNKEETLLKLKSILKEDILLEYSIKTKEYGLSTRVYIRKDDRQLVVRVINPVPLTYSQLERISRKMNASRNYDCLAQFYLENPDPEAEGMGLGLSMVTVLLKGSGIDPDSFRVYSDMKKKTVAELNIPLT
ncbi:MAG: hypothetical protein PF637_03365 [Spirochaetes bacterium]|jgi:hypothetical protein|nr:hypothetical protein [Spirochaetota bacterium]